jgi:hypothetical protein
MSESGLRNPDAAVRGVGAAALALEALVLLLAIQPILQLGGSRRGMAVGAVIGFVVAAVVLAALLRRRWAWYGGTVLQFALLAAGFLHWSLAVLGLIFGLVWAFVLYIRQKILG